MASTLLKAALLVVALVIGIGVTVTFTPLLKNIMPVDQQSQAIIAIVLTIFAYVGVYSLTKGHGGS